MSRIAVIGTGYVGLTTGAYLSHLGHDVVCADVVPEKVERLQRGEIPIFEAGLEELVREGLDGGRLRFVLGGAAAVPAAEFVFLCVPTPQGGDDRADMTYIQQAATEIGPHLQTEAIVINKSTVPVGSTRVVEQSLGRDDVFVVSNPEFLREGSAVHDCLHPDRIVIGSDDGAAAIRVASLFEGIEAPLIVTDPASAETIKYASNAFLATKVSFVNAIANLCEAVGADVREVALGMGYDKRIGFEFLKPGPGWGGSCLVGTETVLVRRGAHVRLYTLEDLFEAVEASGASGWEVLSWRADDPTPEFRAVAAFTQRPFEGEILDIRLKLGRRISVTADHPLVVGDGVSNEPLGVKVAGELTTLDWLPVAQHAPLPLDVDSRVGYLLDALPDADVGRHQVIVRFDPSVVESLKPRWRGRRARLHDITRCNAARLSELDEHGVRLDAGFASTVTNGTYVPLTIPLNAHFWRMAGLYLAEGCVATDGARRRVKWTFHPEEGDLAQVVTSYWAPRGVDARIYHPPTSLTVSISSRILAAWMAITFGLGNDCYSKRLPDAAWTLPDDHKRALLRGLWDGDGSWSLVDGGPSVVYEYGTVSRELADGMVRLLADLGIAARLKVGRTTKSTVDTYWLVIGGADQVEAALWLFPQSERVTIRESIASQRKRIAPTGYRRLLKSAVWVRVARIGRRTFSGQVYSLEVPGGGTFVTSFGVVVHNCFPKDTRALVRIGEDNGYDFSLLRGVIDVNEEQYQIVTEKIERMVGGSVSGSSIGVWGLTFKARTDDLRDSPALEVIRQLRERGAAVKAFDPTRHHPIDGVEVVDDPYAAVDGVTVLAVLTEWDEFRWLDLDKVRGLMAAPNIVDARNLLDPAMARRKGFRYEGIGRA